MSSNLFVRGVTGEYAGVLLYKDDEQKFYSFDQACSKTCHRTRTHSQSGRALSIIFLLNAVYNPRACIEATLKRAGEVGQPSERLSFEIVKTNKSRIDCVVARSG